MADTQTAAPQQVRGLQANSGKEAGWPSRVSNPAHTKRAHVPSPSPSARQLFLQMQARFG